MGRVEVDLERGRQARGAFLTKKQSNHAYGLLGYSARLADGCSITLALRVGRALR